MNGAKGIMEINRIKWTCAPAEHRLNPPSPASLVRNAV
jgi:hypothetical protein